MPVTEAVDFFSNQPSIARHMQTLVDVGLGYVRLGQSAPTLSGGEAQRVKLASELAKRSTGHTMYLLDEPTTGLHFEDVRRLLTVLSRLVDQGNTVLVIEHNLDVIKTADWLIDMGPEGGNGGGTVIAEGSPEVVAQTNGSYTGFYLAPMLGLKQPSMDRPVVKKKSSSVAKPPAKKSATPKAETKPVVKKAVAKKASAKKAVAKRATSKK
jgi:excinuclease ABC subunit A